MAPAAAPAPAAEPSSPSAVAAVAQKYQQEAAKRLRDDGIKQFEPLHFSDNERLRSLVDDRWADHAALDALPVPVSAHERIKFLVVGAGIGGIVMAVKLLQKGFRAAEILLVDAAGGVGGTWYWNRYPGLHCDVESYCYLPLLEETGYMPQQKYSSGVEIRAYLETVVQKFGLGSRILFRTQVNRLEWDDAEKAWRANVTMRRGSDGTQETGLSFYAENVTIANGLFPYAQVPKIAGLAHFGGEMLHTARWNYDITGGSCDETFPELSKLKDKVVGIVGTGATAIQVVPELAKHAKEVYVFQRTPSQVFVRGQRETDGEEWRHSIAAKPGWQRARMENLGLAVAGQMDPEKDLVRDAWSELETFGVLIGSNRFGLITPDKVPQHIGTVLAIDAKHTERARSRIAHTVKDKDTAEKLTPWYPTWCKRPTFSDTYLDAFNRENVHLIDTDGAGISGFTPKGVVANSHEYPIDVLVLSTGYRSPGVGGDPGSRTGTEIVGRHGRPLADKWEKQGVSTLHGVATNGYPNMFFIGASQAAAPVTWTHLVDIQSEHIASIIKTAQGRAGDGKGTPIIEPSVEAEDAWGMAIAQGSAFFGACAICTPNYSNQEGQAFKMPATNDHAAMMKKAKAAIWYQGLVYFGQMLENWREGGHLDGLEIVVG
ncbi:hypothetical protein ACJQWK_09494 [Exserohilum turcicum]